VAVYEGDTQVSEPATPENGACTFNIPAKDLGAGEHTLTVKYIESTVMAQATLTVNVEVDKCTHPTMDSSNKCPDCGEPMMAQVNGTNYTDFAAAWTAATANAGEATLSIISSSPVICQQVLTVPNNVTLHLASGNSGLKIHLMYTAIKVETNGTLILDTQVNIQAYNPSLPALTVNGTLAANIPPDYNESTYYHLFNNNNNGCHALEIGTDAKVDLRYCLVYGVKVTSGTISGLAADGFYCRTPTTGGNYRMLTEKELANQTFTEEIEVWPVPAKIIQQPTVATTTYGTSASCLLRRSPPPLVRDRTFPTSGIG